MERQVDRLRRYPETEDALRRRIEAGLGTFDAGPSTLGEGVLGFVGNPMALGHAQAQAQDEILENTCASHALETFEAAARESLLAVADSADEARRGPRALRPRAHAA